MIRFTLEQLYNWVFMPDFLDTCSPACPVSINDNQQSGEGLSAKALCLHKSGFARASYDRVWQQGYETLSTDTRVIQPGQAYLALQGERFDGHDFLLTAADRGARLMIVRKGQPQIKELFLNYAQTVFVEDIGSEAITISPETIIVIAVEDTLTALQKIANGYRFSLKAKVVAITGSVGKTSTREMVASCLGKTAKVHQTAANLNNEIGLPQTILQADPKDDFVVLEMGMRGQGQISLLSRIACPDISIVTNIGWSHLELLGSRENILSAKTEIIDGMYNKGWLILNEDDQMLSAWRKTSDSKSGKALISAEKSLSAHTGPALWANYVRISEGKTAFTLNCRDLAWPVVLPVPGQHHVRNALMGIMAAMVSGIPVEQAIAGASSYNNTGSRQKIIHIGSICLMDDTYNAAPESMYTALHTLGSIAGSNRKIAVLACMKELGEYSVKAHYEVGRAAAELGYGHLFLLGEYAEEIKKGACAYSENTRSYIFADQQSLIKRLLELVEPGDYLVIKGSRSYAMEKVAAAVENFWRENSDEFLD